MRSLKITLLLAVLVSIFVLTVSGQSSQSVLTDDVNLKQTNSSTLLVHNKDKIKRPSNNM